MLQEGLKGLAILIGYYLIAGSLTLLLKKILNPPSELIRKILHLICVMSVFLLLNVFDTWYMAVFSILTFIILVYPVLSVIEHYPIYKKFLSERKNGEVKMSLIIVCMMLIILIAVFWGWLGASWKYIIVIAVMAWGYGDAVAALVGKAFGRHYIEHRLVEGKKTLEGTLAMFVVAWLAIFITMMIYAVMPWYLCLLVALLVAPICAIVELFSKGGTDTITVPLSAAILLFVLIYFFNQMGSGI